MLFQNLSSSYMRKYDCSRYFVYITNTPLNCTWLNVIFFLSFKALPPQQACRDRGKITLVTPTSQWAERNGDQDPTLRLERLIGSRAVAANAVMWPAGGLVAGECVRLSDERVQLCRIVFNYCSVGTVYGSFVSRTQHNTVKLLALVGLMISWHLVKSLIPVIASCGNRLLLLGVASRRVQSPNDVIQKIEKTPNHPHTNTKAI